MMVYHSEAEEELGDIEENLQQLAVDIPNMTTYEVPRHYQCHTTGVSRRFSRILRRVSQDIAYYYEHHED